METRDEYVKAKKRELDAWNKEMKDLENKARKAEAVVKVKYEEHLAAMHARQESVAKQLEAIKVAGEDSWKKLKTETENVWEALKDSISTFKSHFKD